MPKYLSPATSSNLELFAAKVADPDSVLMNLEGLFMRVMEDTFRASFPLEVRYEMETPELEAFLREQRAAFRKMHFSGCDNCRRLAPTKTVYGLSKPVHICEDCAIELEQGWD